jgi:excisionase family DNA binding protein
MDEQNKEPLRLSIAEAATHLGVSMDTIRRRIRRNEIVAQRDNAGKWFVLVPAERPAAPDSSPGNTAYEQMQAQHRQTLELMQR